MKNNIIIIALFIVLLSQGACKSYWLAEEGCQKIDYTKLKETFYCFKNYLIGVDTNSLVLDGVSGLEGFSLSDKTNYYATHFWGRKIRLRLPKGFKDIYHYDNVIKYPDNTTVWIGMKELAADSSYLDIGKIYKDGIYEPTPELIDSLIRKVTSRHMLVNGDDTINIFTQEPKLISNGKRCVGVYERGLGLPKMSPPMKERRSILSVKDGIFVLVYNIKERDFPLFEAYIRNTFVVCSRYMDIVDENTHEYEDRTHTFPNNVKRSQYMQHRFYKEIPTVTPPDSAQIVDDAWRGTGFTPDMFPNIYLKHPGMSNH